MVKLNNIVKIYNSKKANEFKALHGVSAEIRDGELIAIIGKSGACLLYTSPSPRD